MKVDREVKTEIKINKQQVQYSVVEEKMTEEIRKIMVGVNIFHLR